MTLLSNLSVRTALGSAASAAMLALVLLAPVVHAAPATTPAAIKNMMLAISTDNAYVLKSLLAKGANPNSRTPDRGETPLMSAVRDNAGQSFAVLINTKGVDLNARAKNGDTAMMLAALAGKTEMIKALLDKDAEPNNTGWTALHYAALNGHNAVVSMLLEASAYIDAESPNKTTPLMMAARGGQADTVRLLLEQGADATLKNETGLTAIDYAARAGHNGIADGLRQVAAGHPFPPGTANDITAQDGSGAAGQPAAEAKPKPSAPVRDPSLPVLDVPLLR